MSLSICVHIAERNEVIIIFMQHLLVTLATDYSACHFKLSTFIMWTDIDEMTAK